mmetsp:Transcript_9087/g.13181  ORF Transcript_9087/g.13181 Transcript_9087/m.13181 type:complete len:113 (-) Transcript_9087:333-671(-)
MGRSCDSSALKMLRRRRDRMFISDFLRQLVRRKDANPPPNITIARDSHEPEDSSEDVEGHVPEEAEHTALLLVSEMAEEVRSSTFPSTVGMEALQTVEAINATPPRHSVGNS